MKEIDLIALARKMKLIAEANPFHQTVDNLFVPEICGHHLTIDGVAYNIVLSYNVYYLYEKRVGIYQISFSREDHGTASDEFIRSILEAVDTVFENPIRGKFQRFDNQFTIGVGWLEITHQLPPSLFTRQFILPEGNQ